MKPQKTSSLSRKLFSGFLFSILLPMILVSCLVSDLFISRQNRFVMAQTVNNVTLISAYLNKYLEDIDNLTKAPYYHSYFQSRSSFEDLSPYEQNQIGKEIGQLLQLTTYSREDFQDLVVMSDEKVLYFNSADWYYYLPTVTPLSSRRWYREALSREGRIAIVPGDGERETEPFFQTQNFYISRKLNNLFHPDQVNVIMVQLKTDAFESLFSSLTSQAPIKILFTNEDGSLIYSNGPVDASVVSSLSQKRISSQRKQWDHYSQSLEHYPLKVHVLLDTSYISQQIAAFMSASLVCYLTGLFLAYLLFRKNNQWIKAPTYHIKSVLKELEQGELTARCETLPVSEFQEIASSINTMAHQLEEKIRNEYELNLAQKNLQFRALQSQIQPHFIINTIYSFISLNQIGEQELLDRSFYSFAYMLRYVLSKEQDTTLGKELAFLEDYCSLCLLRFGNRMTYEILCPQELKELRIPRLLLQPLVENAVIHGIEPSEIPCTLSITVSRHETVIYLIVEDNGVGFDTNQPASPDTIGLQNVDTRIRLWNPEVKFHLHRIQHDTIQILTIPADPWEQEA